MQKTQEMWVWPLGQEDPLAKEMATHSSTLAWKIPMNRGAWWATVYGVAKSWTQLKRLGMHISYISSVWLEKKMDNTKKMEFGTYQCVPLCREVGKKFRQRNGNTDLVYHIFFCLLKELLLICTAGQLTMFFYPYCNFWCILFNFKINYLGKLCILIYEYP